METPYSRITLRDNVLGVLWMDYRDDGGEAQQALLPPSTGEEKRAWDNDNVDSIRAGTSFTADLIWLSTMVWSPAGSTAGGSRDVFFSATPLGTSVDSWSSLPSLRHGNGNGSKVLGLGGVVGVRCSTAHMFRERRWGRRLDTPSSMQYPAGARALVTWACPTTMVISMHTYSAKPGEVDRSWFVVDASGETLGRLATRIATVLRGKHKPTFTPHVDTGDYVIVTPPR